MKKFSFFSVFTLSLLVAAVTPLFAQSSEEKNFLLMYFKEEELVVETPTRSPKPVSQVAENITVITASDIELMNAHSLAEVLNTVTGVQVGLTGGPGQIAQGLIQGSETRHVTIIIDGVVLNNISNNTVDLGMVPVQNIEKIEIIKGPASSAWGSALGGVVNIITKAGKSDNQGGMLSASYGKANTDDFRAEVRGKQGRFGYYLTAGRLQSDGLTTHFDVAENNGYTKLSYDLTDQTTVLFTLGYERTVRGTGIDTLFDASFDNIAEIVHSSLAVNSALNKDVELDVSVRTINQEGISIMHQLSSGVFLGSDKEIDKGYGSSAKLTWKSAIQTIVLGTDYDDKTIESKNLAGESKVLTTWALYGNDTLIFDKLSITPGVRYDFTSSNGTIASPSLGIAYSLTNDTILRAYTARGFSTPTPIETFGNDVFYTANPDLKMETVWSYQAGAETAALKYVWMKLSFFLNEIRDAIVARSNPDGTFTNINEGRQRRRGADFEVKTAPVYHVSLSAGAEYIEATDLDTDMRLQNVPSHVYDLGFRYDDEQSFKALLHGRSINWNSQPDFNGKYGSVIWDLNMIKKIFQHNGASLEAFVNAHNMLNGSQYYIDAFKNPGRWYEGGIRYKF
jgi:vitamin B12 transporter